jgi:hypothetical protein
MSNMQERSRTPSKEQQLVIYDILAEHFLDLMKDDQPNDDVFAARDPEDCFDPDTHCFLQVFVEAGYPAERVQSISRLALGQAYLLNETDKLTPEHFL